MKTNEEIREELFDPQQHIPKGTPNRIVHRYAVERACSDYEARIEALEEIAKEAIDDACLLCQESCIGDCRIDSLEKRLRECGVEV